MNDRSYVHSHTAPGKGAHYDNTYRTDSWHRYLWSREQYVLAAILKDYFPQKPVNLLDFACGTGRIVAALEDNVHSSTGVDVSDEMLEVARAKLRVTELHKANLLEDNIFPGRRFDMITAFRFFVNAEPELRRGALRALEPLLAPDGILVFNNHQNADAPSIQLLQVYAAARRLPLANTMTMKQCRELLAGVGLEIDRVYGVGTLHIPRINLPHRLYSVADRFATARLFSSHSESPIIVARRVRA
jgi:ubiquinone/menaquinone biosynthesis C-methylase UbiE